MGIQETGTHKLAVDGQIVELLLFPLYTCGFTGIWEGPIYSTPIPASKEGSMRAGGKASNLVPKAVEVAVPWQQVGKDSCVQVARRVPAHRRCRFATKVIPAVRCSGTC